MNPQHTVKSVTIEVHFGQPEYRHAGAGQQIRVAELTDDNQRE